MQKALVGISGGVDSAVSAYLMKEQGYNVTGAYLIMHDIGEKGTADAKCVADMLGIPFIAIDLKREFEEYIIKYFVSTYSQGRTPNPCIFCNPLIKFETLNNFAEKNSFERIATGHYAGVGFNDKTKRYYIKKSLEGKDQSYALYRLNQMQLSKITFPLYNFTKDKVRAIAQNAGIKVYNKPDSQEICFIKDNNYSYFIENYTGESYPKGFFVLDGQEVGRHKGIIRYTIGQRKKLGISCGCPVYVSKIDTEKNRIILSKDDITDCKGIIVNDIVLQKLERLNGQTECDVKIRYSSKAAKAIIEMISENSIKAEFNEPQRAATPGQSAVFYEGDGILGGGIIKDVIR